MNTDIHIKNGELVFTTDMRNLINGEGRAALVNALAAKLSFTLVRAEHGLSVCVSDSQSGAIMALVSLKELLANSLMLGSLVENALDNLPAEEALQIVHDELRDLTQEVACQIEVLGTPEAFLLNSGPLFRPAEVEQAIDAQLEAVAG